MTIPVSTVVDVALQIGATFPARAGFGTLLGVQEGNELKIPRAERVRAYNTVTAVLEDWSPTSEVAAMATAYFSQQPKPTSFKVGTRYTSSQPAEIIGLVGIDLPTLTAITDGSFSISIDGSAQDVTGVNFSSDASAGDIALTVQLALRAIATGGYSTAVVQAVDDKLQVFSGTSGVASSILFASSTTPVTGTDISELLKLDSANAISVDGINAETITESLSNIENVDPDWYGVCFTKEVRDLVQINGESAVLGAAAWCEARIKAFFNTTNDTTSTNGAVTTDISTLLKSGNYRRTITTFSSFPNQYPSASVAGRAFTVNFSQTNSTITLKFKQLPGITVENLTQNGKAVLDDKNINALIDVGNNFMYAESFMSNGSFFDELHGTDWLVNAVQTNVFGYLLTRTTKVPYTDKGVAALEQQVIRALDEAVNNGLIAPGETIDGIFLPRGYVTTTIPVGEINQSDKEARNYSGLSAVVIGAGAIHGAQINITFER